MLGHSKIAMDYPELSVGMHFGFRVCIDLRLKKLNSYPDTYATKDRLWKSARKWLQSLLRTSPEPHKLSLVQMPYKSSLVKAGRKIVIIADASREP